MHEGAGSSCTYAMLANLEGGIAWTIVLGYTFRCLMVFNANICTKAPLSIHISQPLLFSYFCQNGWHMTHIEICELRRVRYSMLRIEAFAFLALRL